MPDRSVRQRRVADLIARELSVIVQQRARDPRLSSAVITGVRVSGDLRQATVYVTSVLPEERDDVMKALTGSEAYLRKELAERVYLKYVPVLTFRLDTTYDSAHRIESILDGLEYLTPDDDAGEGEDEG